MTEVEVDEVLGLVGDKGSEIAADNTMPSRSFSLVKLVGVRYWHAKEDW